MNNKKRKLFNVTCKVEKLLHEVLGTSVFKKEFLFYRVEIDLNVRVLNSDLLLQLTQLLTNENVKYRFSCNDNMVLTIYQ